MKTLTCKMCGEPVRVHDDAKAVRCSACSAFAMPDHDALNAKLQDKAAELGWPTCEAEREALAWELSAFFPHGRQAEVERNVLAALKGQTEPGCPAYKTGGRVFPPTPCTGQQIVNLCFKETADGRRQPVLDRGPEIGEAARRRTRHRTRHPGQTS